MDNNIHSLHHINDEKQKILNEIKSSSIVLDKTEKLLRKKISYAKTELDELKKKYSNVSETYSRIIKTIK